MVLFEAALAWVRDSYAQFGFVVERDLVWTLQKRLVSTASDSKVPYQIYNDYPLLPGHRADLVIMDSAGGIVLAIEFKYEPSHKRPEFAIPEGVS